MSPDATVRLTPKEFRRITNRGLMAVVLSVIACVTTAVGTLSWRQDDCHVRDAARAEFRTALNAVIDGLEEVNGGPSDSSTTARRVINEATASAGCPLLPDLN